MHRPIAEQGKYLRAVVAGHGRYFAVPCNGACVQAFRFQVGRLWHRTLCRRSQAKHLSWQRMHKIVDHWLPPIRICHPYMNATPHPVMLAQGSEQSVSEASNK